MRWFRILALLLTVAICQRVQAQTAEVTWTTTHQTIDGFGASDFGTAENLTSAQADIFFSTTVSKGAGLSFVREIANEECNGTISDLTTLREAVARGAQVWLTMQSPPVSMKSPGATCSTGSLPPANYSAYASYIVTWIQSLQADGIQVYAVSPVDEPDEADPSYEDYAPNNLGAFQFTPSEIDAFVPILHSALVAAGLSTKVIIGEEGQWFDTAGTSSYSNYPSVCMADSNCAPDVGIIAAHGYGYYPNPKIGYYDSYACCSVVTPAPESTSTGQLWQSEVSWSGSGNVYTGSMADGLVWATNIHNYLTVANATGWFYWMLGGNTWFNDNEGLSDSNLDPAKRLYAIGQWSKFVRPGWVRIDATAAPVSGALVTAFKQASSGSFAIIAVNNNASDTSVTFNLSGFPSSPSSVTPWITSSTLSLAQQPNASVLDGSFTYTLPAYSIISFVGNTTTAAAASPAPPTQLVATVH
jgi:glucuronoarabinoxylan endo-1,4-beta-xylanase